MRLSEHKGRRAKAATSTAELVTVTAGSTALAADLVELAETTRALQSADRAPRTLAAYRVAWDGFAAWCAERNLHAMPAAAELVAMYLTARAQDGRKVATLQQALAAIVYVHEQAGQPFERSAPALTKTWGAIRRQIGTAQRRAAPAVVDELRAMSAALPTTLQGTRDRALLVAGFAGAFRRSELVTLDVSDLAFNADGVVISIRKSKTDQTGKGTAVGLPHGSDARTCPVRTLRAWLDAARVIDGPVFRAVNRHGHVGGALSGIDVARAVKRACTAAGLDASKYSGHSLRAGLATTAAKAGKSDYAIMTQGRWKSRETVARYVRNARLLDDHNAAAGLGL